MRPEPTLEASTRPHFEEYNIFAAPTAMLLLYAASGALSILVIAAGLRSTGIPFRDPLIILGAIVVTEVAITAGLRAVIGDLLRSLSLRERAGFVFIHLAAFALPALFFKPFFFVHCLIGLLVSLHLFLVDRQHFVRLFAVQFAILFLSQLTGVEDDLWSFATVAGAMALFALATHALHAASLMEKYERVFAISLGWLARALSPTVAALALVGGGVFAAMPGRDYNARPRLNLDLDFSSAVAHRQGGTLKLGEGAFYAVAIAGMAILLLWIAAKIRDRLAQGRQKDFDFGLNLDIEEDVPEGSRESHRKVAPRDPRQSVIVSYLDFCRRIGDLTEMPRLRAETAAEYRGRLLGAAWLSAESDQLAALTQEFERARYGSTDIGAEEAAAFRESTRELVERARALEREAEPRA